MHRNCLEISPDWPTDGVADQSLLRSLLCSVFESRIRLARERAVYCGWVMSDTLAELTDELSDRTIGVHSKDDMRHDGCFFSDGLLLHSTKIATSGTPTAGLSCLILSWTITMFSFVECAPSKI